MKLDHVFVGNSVYSIFPISKAVLVNAFWNERLLEFYYKIYLSYLCNLILFQKMYSDGTRASAVMYFMYLTFVCTYIYGYVFLKGVSWRYGASL